MVLTFSGVVNIYMNHNALMHNIFFISLPTSFHVGIVIVGIHRIVFKRFVIFLLYVSKQRLTLLWKKSSLFADNTKWFENKNWIRVLDNNIICNLYNSEYRHSPKLLGNLILEILIQNTSGHNQCIYPAHKIKYSKFNNYNYLVIFFVFRIYIILFNAPMSVGCYYLLFINRYTFIFISYELMYKKKKN